MKICFVVNSLFTLGGEQRVLTVLANELAVDHEIVIYTFDEKSQEDRTMYGLVESINVRFLNMTEYSLNTIMNVERIPTGVIRRINSMTDLCHVRRLGKLFAYGRFPIYLRKKWLTLFKEAEFDVIIGLAGNAFPLAAIAPKLRCKVIGWQHNSYEAYLETPNLYFWKLDNVFQYLIPRLDTYVVLKEHDKRMYDRMQIRNVSVIPNPVSFKSDQKASGDKHNFLAVGRLDRAKGFDLLIESFYYFSQKNDDWNLMIVGEGWQKEELENLILHYQLTDRVKLCGFTNEIQKYYLDASVYLLSSRWEGFGLVVVEAMEMGLPVIAYDLTAMENIICDGENGLLVKSEDVVSFAGKMDYLVRNAEIRREMSENAIRSVEKYHMEHIRNHWDRLII